MAHLRERFLSKKIEKYLKFWPVVGIVGLRQSGKTTIVTKILQCGKALTLDELELREEANASPKTFLSRQERPVVIDEAQKAPNLFDAIKVLVDKKRVPGEFVLTGSCSFSSKVGIRESLTGRIGLVQLRPLSLAELHQSTKLQIKSLVKNLDQQTPRFSISDFAKAMQLGGMPGVAFVRDEENRQFYWKSWLETTLTRDLPRLFKRSYDPEIAFSIIQKIAKVLIEGDLPSLQHFHLPARKVRVYLDALCEIFVLQRIMIHEYGFGKDVWLLSDSGLAKYLMQDADGLMPQLSLARHFLWNEWQVHQSLDIKEHPSKYYKSAQGSPVDAVIDDVPVLIAADSQEIARRLSWVERPVRGAMKKLGVKNGIIAAPIDYVIKAKDNDGVAVVPWSIWC